jgi:hypothetical protein
VSWKPTRDEVLEKEKVEGWREVLAVYITVVTCDLSSALEEHKRFIQLQSFVSDVMTCVRCVAPWLDTLLNWGRNRTEGQKQNLSFYIYEHHG